MSSRTESKKRERSWERDDRDRDRHSRGGRSNGGSYRGEGRRRSSRSRSPRRGGDRDMERDKRGGLSHNLTHIYALIYLIDKRERDYRRDRPDDRRGDHRGERERDRRGDDRRRDRGDDRREPLRRDDRDLPAREDRKLQESEVKDYTLSKSETAPTGRSVPLHFHSIISSFFALFRSAKSHFIFTIPSKLRPRCSGSTNRRWGSFG